MRRRLLTVLCVAIASENKFFLSLTLTYCSRISSKMWEKNNCRPTISWFLTFHCQHVTLLKLCCYQASDQSKKHRFFFMIFFWASYYFFLWMPFCNAILEWEMELLVQRCRNAKLFGFKEGFFNENGELHYKQSFDVY